MLSEKRRVKQHVCRKQAILDIPYQSIRQPGQDSLRDMAASDEKLVDLVAVVYPIESYKAKPKCIGGHAVESKELKSGG